MVDCPICQAVNTAEFYDDNLSYCWSCAHLFQTDLTVTMTYDAKYAHAYDALKCLEMSKLRWDYINSTLDLHVRSKVLDIGYGNGAFLKYTKTMGMDIYGADLHHEDFGIPEVTLDTDIEFDLVCFFDSLEHFPSFDVLKNLKTRNIIVSVPDPPPYKLTNLEPIKKWKHFKPGEHLHYFSLHGLDNLMYKFWKMYRVSYGHPEDSLRGRCMFENLSLPNILSVVYSQ